MLLGVRVEEKGGGGCRVGLVWRGRGYCCIFRRWRGCLGVQKSVLDT